jgi:hypothetical protein
MSRRFAHAGVALLIAAAPRVVTASAGVPISVTYDTVDFVEIKNQELCDGCSRSEAFVIVRGVASGAGTPSTGTFNFGSNKDMATRCEHLATIAMAKPGKYQFAIGADNSSSPEGGHGHCKLILVSP